MWKNHFFSVLVGVGIGLAINLQRAGLGGTTSSEEVGTINNTTSPLPQSQEEKEKPSLKQLKKSQRFQAARDSIANTGGGTVVRSDFLQDLEALHTLANTSLWLDCAEDEVHYWMDKDAATTTVWQELAREIWKHHPVVQDDDGFAGYEYWCNILTHDAPLVWHVDKDETVLEETGKFVHPIMGAVYYGFPHLYQGGYLEILPVDQRQVSNPEEYYQETDNVPIERIEAKYNRLVILNVSKWHRVSPITNGARFTFAVNVWKEKPKMKEGGWESTNPS